MDVATLRRCRIVVGSACLLLLAAAGDVLAANRIWTGNGADTQWNTAGNWLFGLPVGMFPGQGPPSANDDLTFGSMGAAQKTNNNNIGSGTNFSSITFSDGGYSISGQAITIGGSMTTGGITVNNGVSANNTFGPSIQLGKAQSFINNGSGSLNFGSVNFAGFVLTLDGAGQIAFNNTISNSVAGWTKNGTGNLIVNGIAPAAGTLTLNNGTASISGTIGNVLLGGATLGGLGNVGNVTTQNAAGCKIKPGAPAAVNATFTAAAVTLDSNCTVAINISSSQTDKLATTSINLAGAQLSVTLIGGVPAPVGTTFTIVTGTRTGSFAPSIVNVNGRLFNVVNTVNSVQLVAQPGTRTWSGASSGAGGNDNWSNDANWAEGSAPISGDTLVFPDMASRKSNNNDLTNALFQKIFINGKNYVLGGNALRLADGIVESAGSAGTPAVINFDIGADANQAFVANIGGFTLGGTLTLTTSTAMPSTVTFTALNAGSIAATGVVTGSGGIIKNGAGTLTLSGNNTYQGTTSVDQGRLIITSATALGQTGAGTTVSSGATLQVSGVATPISEPLTLSGTGVGGAIGALTTTSCLLAVVCAWSAPVTLSGDTLIRVDSSQTLRIGGVISESGGTRALTKQGTGTLILSSANTYTGLTTVAAGFLQVDGTIGAVMLQQTGLLAGNGTTGAVNVQPGVQTGIAPGASAGILRTGSVVLDPQSQLRIEVGGTTAGTLHDQLQVTGTLALNGAQLQVTNIGLFAPPVSSQYTIVTATGGISGQFGQGTSVTLSGTPMTITYNANSIVLTAPSTAKTLTVTKPGSGSGTVENGDGRINCGPTCTNTFGTGTELFISATADAGSVFTGWLGACKGTGPNCVLQMTVDRNVSATFAPATISNRVLDVDLNNQYDALTDGIMIIRALFGLPASAVANGALGPSPMRPDPDAIAAYINDIKPKLDADGNGNSDALTDGIIIIRFLFNITDDSMISNALGPNPTRTTAAAIAAYLQTLKP